MNGMRSVYVPSAVSCFFTFEGFDPDGSLSRPLEEVGARGGGFKLVKGTHTTAERLASPADEVFFDGRPVANSTTQTVLDLVRKRTGSSQRFRIEHRVEVPIGAGFGTSASASLGASTAALLEIGYKSTSKLAADIAHEADIVCHTGLGTVGAICTSSGVGGLIVKGGGPGACRIEAFMEDFEKCSLIALTFASRQKRLLLTSPELMSKVNAAGEKVMKAVLADPSASFMLKESRKFALETGLGSKDADKACSLLEEAGAIAAAHNMIGEAVHAIAWRDDTRHITARATEAYPSARLTVSKLSEASVRVND
jgi:pantoate kinase